MVLSHQKPSGNSSVTLMDRPPSWNQHRQLMLIGNAFESQETAMPKHLMDGVPAEAVSMTITGLLSRPVPAFLCWTLVVDRNGESKHACTVRALIRDCLRFYDERREGRPVVITYAPGLNGKTLMDLAEAGSTVIAEPLLKKNLEPLRGERDAGSGLAQVRAFLNTLLEKGAITLEAPYVKSDQLFAWGDTGQPRIPQIPPRSIMNRSGPLWDANDVMEDYSDIAESISASKAY